MITIADSNVRNCRGRWKKCTTSAKINISYSILFHLTTSYSSYFGGKKGISRNKTSFFLLMHNFFSIYPFPSWLHAHLVRLPRPPDPVLMGRMFVLLLCRRPKQR